MNWRLLILFTLALNISSSEKNYVFGWTQLDNPELHVPRGGTSSCPAVDLDQTPFGCMRQDLTLMNKDQIKRFIMFYERVTKHMLRCSIKKADFVINIDDKHRLKSMKLN